MRWSPSRLSAVGLGSLALLTFAPASARAQEVTGFGLSRFEPSERGSEWFALESLDLRGHLRPAIGVVGEYQYRPLAIYENGEVRTAIVNHLFIVHPGASLVLWDRLRLAANLPVQLYGEGTRGQLGPVVYPAPSSDQSIGDVRLGADVRLLGVYGDAATIAVGAQVALPTGDRDSYAGDGSARFTPRATIAGDIGPIAYAGKLGFQYRARSETFASSPIGSEFVFGASAGVRAADKKLLIGPELYGSTVTDGDQQFGRRTTPVEVLFGAHYTTGEVRFGGGLGAGLGRGFGTPVLHLLAGIEWVPGVESDRDKDGIKDSDDACPDTPGVRTSSQKTNGCPPTENKDRDHDGILDVEDACPDDPGPATNNKETTGCPDRDKDGVIDKVDACPDVLGVRSTDPAKNGCPADRDGDGIFDDRDACPDEPGVASTDPSKHGCPDPDRDKDGIPNQEDACPDEPGGRNPDPKKNGCPAAFVRAGQIIIIDQVKFKTSSYEILPGKDSEDVLNAVLGVLSGHAEIKKVRVEGYTDNRGDAGMNKTLSANRAASVVKWLVAHGVEAERLTSTGFGADRPIDDNTSENGRRNNRRVEFHIQDTAPTPQP